MTDALDLLFIEIASVEDILLLPWLDLYEMAFPPEERELVSSHLDDLRAIEQGSSQGIHFLAVLDPDSRFVGMAKYQVLPELDSALLWYLAVDQSSRGCGIGAATYQEITSRVRSEAIKAMLLEVEIPEEQPTPSRRNEAKKRIEFYQKLGARLLTGIHYMMTVGPHQPPLPFHIMVHPFVPMTPKEAYDLVESVFEDSVRQVGDLKMD